MSNSSTMGMQGADNPSKVSCLCPYCLLLLAFYVYDEHMVKGPTANKLLLVSVWHIMLDVG